MTSRVDRAALRLAVDGRASLAMLDEPTARAAVSHLAGQGMSPAGIADRLRTTVAIVREHRGGARSGADAPPSESTGHVLVRKRSGGTCEGCGLVEAQSWSHRIPKGNGGLWSAANGLDFCGTGTTGCHGLLEGDRRAHQVLGWALTRRQDPTTTQVVIWNRGARVRALLDDLGGLVVLGPAVTEGN